MKKNLLSLVVFVFFYSASHAQVYVSESGGTVTRDGASWATAYQMNELQQAINEAQSATIKQVWVAKGTYKPTESLSSTGFLTNGTTPVSDRDKTFILLAGVEIYGGFAGNETSINNRVLTPDGFMQNETILSGDLNNNNMADDGDFYHVVSSRNDNIGAVLDGFTIQFGFANGTNSITEGGMEVRQNTGAAIVTMGGNSGATYRNLIIKNNVATDQGGAIYIRATGTDRNYQFNNVQWISNKAKSGGAIYYYTSGGTPVLNIKASYFYKNESTATTGTDGGGAIYYDGRSGLGINILNNTRFVENITSRYGGALLISKGIANVNTTTFEKNNAKEQGGAIFTTGSTDAALNLINSSLNENSAKTAGHFYLNSGIATIENTILQRGTATTEAGAIYVNGNATKCTIKSSVLKNNTSAGHGGAISSRISDLSVSNSQFQSNTASKNGGAFYINSSNGQNANVTIWNTEFFDNLSKMGGTGSNGGGAVYQTYQGTDISTTTIVNSTFYANKSLGENGAFAFNSNENVKINLYNNIFNGNLADYVEATLSGDAEAPSADIRRSASVTSAVQNFKNNLFQTSIDTKDNRTVTNAFLLANSGDPLFASTDKLSPNFLHIASASIVINNGDNALYNLVGNSVTDKDLAGLPRLIGTNIDLGSFEYQSALPVSITSFSAISQHNIVLIKWKVEEEKNVSLYEIERSSDAKTFYKIATTNAAGATAYNVNDESPLDGVNFYRLKTIDLDGSFKYYERIITAKVSESSLPKGSVYPNPFNNSTIRVTLTGLKTGNYEYTLVNLAGSLVSKGTLNYTGAPVLIELPTSLIDGIYLISLGDGNQQVRMKVVKKH